MSQDNTTTLLAVGGLLGGGLLLYYAWRKKEEPPPDDDEDGNGDGDGDGDEAEAARREYEFLLADLQSRIAGELAGEWTIAVAEFKVEAAGLTTVAGVRAVYDRVMAEAIGAVKVSCIIHKTYFLSWDALKEHLRTVHPLPSVQTMLATMDTRLCYDTSALLSQYHNPNIALIGDMEYEALMLATYRRWYYLTIRYLGSEWRTSADDYWTRTEGASRARCEAIYNNVLATGPLPEPPPPPSTLGEQLAEIMPYLERVSVWRNSEWLIWDAETPSINNLWELYQGEEVHIKVTQICTLGGETLTVGWNKVRW